MRLLQHTVRPPEAGMKLLDFLAARLDLSRRNAKDLLNSRSVLVNRKRIWMARHPLRPQMVFVTPRTVNAFLRTRDPWAPRLQS